VGHLAAGAPKTEHGLVLRRRSEHGPELPLDRDEVIEMFWALARIQANTLKILSILRGEDDEEEEEIEP
jgi:hypothetical protein